MSNDKGDLYPGRSLVPRNPGSKARLPRGVAAWHADSQGLTSENRAVHALPLNRVRYWGVWEGVTSEGLGRTFGGSVKGDKRTGPALNPLKGSSARVPQF
jgi:hypothetical protein